MMKEVRETRRRQEEAELTAKRAVTDNKQLREQVDSLRDANQKKAMVPITTLSQYLSL